MNVKLNVRRFAAICGLALLLAAPGAALAQRGFVRDVTIVDFAFEPPSLTYVFPGTSVRWFNAGATAHTVMSRGTPGPSSQFFSGQIAPGGEFSVTLWDEGLYSYYCTNHPEMTGTIQVGVPAPELPW